MIIGLVLAIDKVRTAYDETMGGGRIKLKEGDVSIDDGKWLGIDGSNPRIKFDGTSDRVEISDADVKLSNNKYLGLGSTTERIEFQGDDDEINIMGANVGIGTLAPDAELEVEGSILVKDGGSIMSEGDKMLVIGNKGDSGPTSILTVGGDGGKSKVVAISNSLSLETQRNIDDIYFKTGSSNVNDSIRDIRMHIDGGDGNVGIGKKDAIAKLEVDGEARLSDATDMGSNDASLATKKYVDDAIRRYK